MAIPMKQALAIGNDAYPGENRLHACVNDATDMTNSLRSMGFQVYGQKDLDYYSMQALTQRFIRSIKPGAIVFFYFSGHGIQSDGYNFLIPTGNDSLDQYNIKESSLSAERLIYDMHLRNPRVVIVVLDCCRTYWGPGSLLPDAVPKRIRTGLAPMQTPPATIVVYSCAAESTSSAKSRNDRNSMYTYHLLRYIATPNIDIDYILRKVALDVQRDTDNGQIPYRYSSCNEPICLVGSSGINVPAWSGLMQPAGVFPSFKKLSPRKHSNQYFQPPIDRYQNRWNYQFYKPKHHHSSHTYNPSKMMRYPTGLGYPFMMPLHYRR